MKEAVPGWHAQRVTPVVSDPALVLTDLVGAHHRGNRPHRRRAPLRRPRAVKSRDVTSVVVVLAPPSTRRCHRRVKVNMGRSTGLDVIATIRGCDRGRRSGALGRAGRDHTGAARDLREQPGAGRSGGPRGDRRWRWRSPEPRAADSCLNRFRGLPSCPLQESRERRPPHAAHILRRHHRLAPWLWRSPNRNSAQAAPAAMRPLPGYVHSATESEAPSQLARVVRAVAAGPAPRGMKIMRGGLLSGSELTVG
jgi:hypothetical protein